MPLSVSPGDECLDLDTDELSWLVGEEAPGVLVREHDPTIQGHDEQSVRNGIERRVSF